VSKDVDGVRKFLLGVSPLAAIFFATRSYLGTVQSECCTFFNFCSSTFYQETHMASNQGNNNNPEGKNQFSSGNQSGGQGNQGGQANQGNQGGQSGKSGQGNQGGQNQSDTSNRGFASMDPQRQREIASEGGKASHQNDNEGGSESGSGRDQDRGRNEGSGSGGSNQSR
jgi:hypothetical protein